MLTTDEKKARRRSLGASEIAAVCGLDPFRGIWDVWASKVGLGIENDVPGAEMGHLFERPLLEHYSRKTGIALTYPKNMRHPKYDWVSATPDGLGKDCVVQVKMVGTHMAHHWGEEPPKYVVIQVQWEMMVVGVPLAAIVACIGGTDYRTHDVPADAQMQEDLLDIGRQFWYEHVLANVPPDPDESEACRRALAKRYSRFKDEYAPASKELAELAFKYRELGKQIKVLTTEQSQIGNLLRYSIGEGAGLTFPGGRVQWKPQKGKPSYKDVAEELGASAALIKKHTPDPERVLRVYVKGEEAE